MRSSQAPDTVVRYSSLPLYNPFLNFSNRYQYQLSSSVKTKHIALNISFSALISVVVNLLRYLPMICGLYNMCSPPAKFMSSRRELNLLKYSSSDYVWPCFVVSKNIICSCKVKYGFAFMSTPAVFFFIFWISHKVSKSDDFFSYSASPLIFNLNGGVHFTMTIPHKLFVLSINIYSQSMYRLTRIYHMFILIFNSSSFYVR